jgi:PAS domain-containing protein
LNRQIQEQIALERQRSQELAQVVLALRDSEGRFRLLVEVSFEAVAVSDHGRIIEVNSNFSTMFGYDDQTRLAAYYLHTAEGLPPVRTTAP